MKTTRRRPVRAAALTAVVLAGALTLAACDDDNGGGSTPPSGAATTSAPTSAPTETTSAADLAVLDKITVTGEVGKKPTVKFDAPLSVTGSAAKVIVQGKGDAIQDGQQITVHIAEFKGEDGSAVGDTFSSDPQTFTYSTAALSSVLYNALQGTHVGTRVLLGSTTTDAEGKASTLFDVVDVMGAKTIPTRASGSAVSPAPGLPTVTLADNGEPTITVPKDYKAPDKLVVQTLIKGDGKKVEADDTLTVQYKGQLLDGTVFDSSWQRGAPASFPLSNVIKGWQQGLVGQTVGSQVLLVVPASLGYGDQAQGSIPANSTLVFVVDILDAQ